MTDPVPTKNGRKKTITEADRTEMILIGKRIAAFRTERNLSQREFMDFLNKEEPKKISQTKMTNAETGFTMKSQIDVVRRISKKFEIEEALFIPPSPQVDPPMIANTSNHLEEQLTAVKESNEIIRNNNKLLRANTKLQVAAMKNIVKKLRSPEIKKEINKILDTMLEL